MSATLVLLVSAVMALPYAVDLRGAAPSTAVALWLSALLMRAAIVLASVVYLVMFLPRTAVFTAVTHWCWHTVIPLLATHLDIVGHDFGDAALVLPGVALAVSLASVAFGIARAAHSVGCWLRGGALGAGPRDSVIVTGADVFVAVAGLRRPRVVVSAGALMQLDDEELAAGLDHERGHIARHHRYVLVVAELARAFARALPGTRHAMSELRFHVERDADRWALRRDHDPLALASAICKAAASRAPDEIALTPLGGGGRVGARLGELTGEDATPCGAIRDRLLRVLAVACATVALATSVAVPVAAAASADRLDDTGAVRHCRD